MRLVAAIALLMAVVAVAGCSRSLAGPETATASTSGNWAEANKVTVEKLPAPCSYTHSRDTYGPLPEANCYEDASYQADDPTYAAPKLVPAR